MNKIRKIGSSLLMILFMICMTMTISVKVEAGYTYKVSFIIGGTGDEGASFKTDYGSYLNVSNPEAEISVTADCVTVKNLKYNDEISFNPKDAVKIEKADSEAAKYYVKGCRRSGDNASSNQSAFSVKKDDSYVIAYGVGTVVPYQVKYLDEKGSSLAESVTYYGGAGEEVYVPYKYIDGYTPKVNNYHIESLKENQVIEFTYTKAKAPSGTTTYINDSRTEYSTVKGQDSIIYQPTENQTPVDEGGVINNRETTPNANPQNTVDQNDEEADNVEEIQDESTPAAREDIVDIPDEDTAKGILDNKAEQAFMFKYSLLIAILGVALVLIFVVAAIQANKEKREKN
ncbi:MAG: hypothetical protein E7272_01180 [Pseudobutyrivibrio ruminis]|uniref:MucBP domain-containing protein n=1 Tax=Pseudobutyrivibrio ruminis TaxID=46206 RepID=A0A927U531_9FIRM|nr:hypothetical protein [Pseudobutyrivibrio ruminis]